MLQYICIKKLKGSFNQATKKKVMINQKEAQNNHL